MPNNWVGTYKLDERGEPVPCFRTIEWAEWYETADRRVAYTDTGNGCIISTIFLGLDFNFNPMRDPLTYKPVLWETLIMGGPLNGRMWRYHSRELAELGHKRAVGMALGLVVVNTGTWPWQVSEIAEQDENHDQYHDCLDNPVPRSGQRQESDEPDHETGKQNGDQQRDES
ncbi:MAG TPA: hypothetical protein VGH83_05575 [Candidatus Acidoferrum sp.]|jgi:hypothetical protein